MKAQTKALARILFKKKVYACVGQEFEDLFVAVMTGLHADFTPIRPQGKIGDRKNDGYIPSIGRYHQVFAPDNSRLAHSNAVNKARRDFAGLMDYWDTICPVKEYLFTFNDKYTGSFPTIEKALAEIKKKHALDDCRLYLTHQLETDLMSLPEDVIVSIVGFIPDPDAIGNLDYSILAEVIGHVMKHARRVDLPQILVAPQFLEKVAFNGLSPQVGELLRQASYQAGTLERYFQMNSDFSRQELRNQLNGLYLTARARRLAEADPVENSQDLIFFDVLDGVTPTESAAVQNAALVVMAYFFESCDIFEDPGEATNGLSA